MSLNSVHPDMYSELYTHSRFRSIKILSGIAVFVLAAASIFLFTQDSAPTRASKKQLIEHSVVNVSPRQIGVFWQVDEPDTGWLIYGKSPTQLDQIALDMRDTTSEKGLHTYHYALLQTLEPNTTYYYKIISDNELVTPADDESFKAQTLSATAPSSTLSPIYGKVLKTNGQPAKNAFALVMIGNAEKLLSISGSTGEWLVPLQYIVQEGSQNSVPVTEETLVTIQIFDDTSRSLVRSTINRSRPIPQPVTLGNNYSFIADSEVLAATDSQNKNSSATSYSVTMKFPRQNAVIPGTAPLIKGTGIPGKTVEIVINSKPEIKLRTTVDDQGIWTAPLKTTLNPGEYSVQIVTENTRGDQVRMSRDFTLIKSGERVLGDTDTATPSGSIAPSPTTRPSPSIVVSTASPTPSPTVTPAAVVTASATVTPMVVTATPAPPVSGVNAVPYMFAGLGMVILGIGVVLLL